MTSLFPVFVKAHIALLVILTVVFLLEYLTGSITFFRPLLRKKKDETELRGMSLCFSFLYFAFMLFYLLLEMTIFRSIPRDFSYGWWFYISSFMALLFWNIYFGFHKKRLKDSQD